MTILLTSNAYSTIPYEESKKGIKKNWAHDGADRTSCVVSFPWSIKVTVHLHGFSDV